MHKVLIGLISYNDLHFLKESLIVVDELRRTLPADVVILDTAGNDDIKKYVQDEYPDFNFIRHPEGNIGYGRGYSFILKHAQETGKGADPKYYLVYTSDVFLDVSVVKEFEKRMEKEPELTMCAGKLYYWDIENHRKTQQIDSLGIQAHHQHHFIDRGHGEIDHGQYDESLENVFGISGAVFMIRTAVIPKLHGNSWQLFDDRMWMYKEDIDLSYRLRWLDEKIHIFPEVWGWHARTVANKEGQGLTALARADRGKRDYARIHSYKNHILLLKNNFSFKMGPVMVLRVLFYEFLKGIHTLFLHPRVFFAGVKTLLFVPGQRCDRIASARMMKSYFR